MWTAEVAADDVRLSLASAEETAGLGCEFGLVAGPVLLGQAVLEVGVEVLVGVQLGRVRRQEVQFDLVGVGGEPVMDLPGAVGGVSVDDEVDLGRSGQRAGPGSGTSPRR